MSVQKNFKVLERTSITLGMIFTNVFNHNVLGMVAWISSTPEAGASKQPAQHAAQYRIRYARQLLTKTATTPGPERKLPALFSSGTISQVYVVDR